MRRHILERPHPGSLQIHRFDVFPPGLALAAEPYLRFEQFGVLILGFDVIAHGAVEHSAPNAFVSLGLELLVMGNPEAIPDSVDDEVITSVLKATCLITGSLVPTDNFSSSPGAFLMI